MADGSTLDLRSVIERFDASNEALDQLRERLQGLALAQETQEQAATALAGTAETITAYGGQAYWAAEALRTASDEIRGAMEAAAQFLAGTDLGAVHQTIDEMRQSVTGVQATLEQQTAELKTAQSAIEQVAVLVQGQLQAAQRELAAAQADAASLRQQVAAAQQDAHATRAAMADLQSKVATIPERARNKAGL